MERMRKIPNAHRWEEYIFFPKAIYRCNAIPVNIPTAFATELDKQSYTLYRTTKDLEWPQQYCKRGKLEVSQSQLSILFQSCSNPNSMVGTGVKNSHIAQWNRTENLEINPQLHGQLMFPKQERLSSGEKAVSSPNGVGKTGQVTCQRMNLDQFLYHTQK